MTSPPLTQAELLEDAGRCRALWATALHRILLDAPRADAHGVAARAWLASPDTLLLDAAGLDIDAATLRMRLRAA